MAGVGHTKIGVLGPLFPRHITRPAQRRLLSVLLLHHGSDLDRDYLADCMWGSAPPRSARNALHVHISGLRNAIPEDIVTTTRHGYRIDPDGDAFDVSVFERLSVAAHNEPDPGERLRLTTDALDLWRGDPYQELVEDTFVLPEVARLKERRLGLLELHMQVLLALGQHNEAIPQLRELVERFPLRERLHEDLMLALYRSGRQAESLRQFQEARRILGEQVGIEPGPALTDLESRILLQDPGLESADIQIPHHSLPWFTTSFVGRDHDAVSTVEALRVGRLVSIVGGPGVGKTRLAVELGHALLGDYPGGVWFVALTEARTAEDVVALIAAGFQGQHRISGIADLVRAVVSQPALLILDNCEHVVDSCTAFVSAVHAEDGELRILITNRARLGVDGEMVWKLDPLPVPAEPVTDMVSLDVAANEAVRLFVDRAQAADKRFALSPRSVAGVVELAQQLGGVPAAIESAARKVSALGITEIATMLDPPDSDAPRFDEAHVERSFRATVERSLARLPIEDRELLDDTAVFNGWFGFPDLEAVCVGTRDRAQLGAAMVRIVDASLLLAARCNDGSMRYRMLVPIRELLMASRRPAHGATEEVFVRHYLSRALTRSHSHTAGTPGAQQC